VRTLLDDPPRIAVGPGSRDKPLRRFALIGDVHAEDERLATSIALARRESVEAILCVGDVADGYGDLERTIEILERERVHVVRGNHDRWFVKDEMRTMTPIQLASSCPRAAEAARLWPPLLEVETIAGTLLLCHGVADDDMAVIKSHTRDHDLHWIAAWSRLTTRARHRFMAAGHTHEAMVRTIGAITILNPGTLKRDASPCVAIVDVATSKMDVHTLDDPHAAVFARALTW
jgi:predicted phosphodiesterase